VERPGVSKRIKRLLVFVGDTFVSPVVAGPLCIAGFTCLFFCLLACLLALLARVYFFACLFQAPCLKTS